VDENGKLSAEKAHSVQALADLSVLAFLKIIAKVERSNKLYKYRFNPKLQEIDVNFKVCMGFGLHIGWGIEGAIGS